MPMRNQSHHHSEHHYRGNERDRERQGGKDGESELEMEPHTSLQQPMSAAQRKKETVIPNVSCAIPKKRAKGKKRNWKKKYETSANIIKSASKKKVIF